MERAVKQFRRYELETPEMMTMPQVFNVTHLIEYFYGVTWNYSRKNIFEWKTQRDEAYKSAVQSFFGRAVFIKLVKEWILFFSKEDELQKTILRQHQTRAAVKVVGRCADPAKKTGLVWHTQGSGKTFTLITAARLGGAMRGLFRLVIVLIFASSVSWCQAFSCQVQGEGWQQLLPGQFQVIYSGISIQQFRLAVQPAVSGQSGVIVSADGSEKEIASVPSYTDVQGQRITIMNRSGSTQSACFAGGAVHSMTGTSGFHCQDYKNAKNGVSYFKLLGGQQTVLYTGDNPSSMRVTVEPSQGASTGVTFGKPTSHSLNVPSAPSTIEVQFSHIVIINGSAKERDGCFLTSSATPSLPSPPPSSNPNVQIIRATLDSTGQHPGTAAIAHPASITCLTAQSDLPNPQPPPSCYVLAPGFTGEVDPNGTAVGSSGAGTVILNCDGQGNQLSCSAKITD